MANTNRMPTVPALAISMLFMLLLLLAIVPLVLAGYPKIDQTGGFKTITRPDNSDDGLKDVACTFAGEAIGKVLGSSYPIKTCKKINVTRRGGMMDMVKLSIKKNSLPGDYDCTVSLFYDNKNGVYTYWGHNSVVRCTH